MKRKGSWVADGWTAEVSRLELVNEDSVLTAIQSNFELACPGKHQKSDCNSVILWLLCNGITQPENYDVTFDLT